MVKRPKKREQTETQIVKACLDTLALRYKGIVKAWRNNTGVAWQPKGKGEFMPVRYGIVGQADITGVVKADCAHALAHKHRRFEHSIGLRLEIEVKRPGKKPAPAQVLFGKMITDHGGIYIVVHSAEEMEAELCRLGISPTR
jgi:hypothetical protein